MDAHRNAGRVCLLVEKESKRLKISLRAKKVDIRLPGKGNSNSHGARPVHPVISIINLIRTRRLSIKTHSPCAQKVTFALFALHTKRWFALHTRRLLRTQDKIGQVDNLCDERVAPEHVFDDYAIQWFCNSIKCSVLLYSKFTAVFRSIDCCISQSYLMHSTYCCLFYTVNLLQ